MKTAIFYVSKHHPTEKVAKLIGDSLSVDKTNLINLKRAKDYDLEQYDAVILGSSLSSGKIHKEMRKFISINAWKLLKKPLGLYLFCLDKSNAAAQLHIAYPSELQMHSKSCRAIGSDLNFNSMNVLQRIIVQKFSAISDNSPGIDSNQLDAFIEDMKK